MCVVASSNISQQLFCNFLLFFFHLDIPRFNALCRGEELRPLNYVAKLKCYLKHNNDPFYRLNPFKEEVVHLEPGIWVYHDVASALDTDAIRSTAAPFVSYCYIHILGSWYFLFLISKWKYYFTKTLKNLKPLIKRF